MQLLMADARKRASKLNKLDHCNLSKVFKEEEPAFLQGDSGFIPCYSFDSSNNN